MIGSTWTNYGKQIELLDENQFTLVSWDPPGYGFSRPPERKMDALHLNRDADYAYQLTQHIGIQQFSVVGFCDGAVSAMILAATHPESVTKIILLNAKSYICFKEMEFVSGLSN